MNEQLTKIRLFNSVNEIRSSYVLVTIREVSFSERCVNSLLWAADEVGEKVLRMELFSESVSVTMIQASVKHQRWEKVLETGMHRETAKISSNSLVSFLKA